MAEFIPLGLGTLRPRPATRKQGEKPAPRQYERHELNPPPRPSRYFIPTQESIEALIERALVALTRGIYWDRGSIINVVI